MESREIARVDAGSIRFSYPANWSPEVEETDEGISIVLQSPDVSFLVIGVYDASQDPDDLVSQAIESLREEHPALELEEFVQGKWEDRAGAEAVFMSLDTVSYAWIRGGRLGSKSLLVFMQSVEREAKRCQAVFEAVCASAAPVDDPPVE